MDLDEVGSPADIAARIHKLLPDLPPKFSIEMLCRQLDITDIKQVATHAYEAALLMDPDKASGSIVLAAGRSPERHRFSIGHELGHFLIPTHKPRPGAPFSCSIEDLRTGDTRERDIRKRTEAEANRFAARLLMPPARIRANCQSRHPDLADVVRLASEFGVSREAMARGYIEAHRDTLAVVILHRGLIDRIYRPECFPWIEPRRGQPVPEDSIASGHHLQPGQISEMEECEPETWFDERGVRGVEVLSEQIHVQQNDWATVLLHAKLTEQD